MNRRGFFKALAATAFIATASTTRLGKYVVEVEEDVIAIGASYAEHLARSLIETKETLAANILNSTFTTVFAVTREDGVALISCAHPFALRRWWQRWLPPRKVSISEDALETMEIWVDKDEEHV